jgi:molybdopterin synthase catalytic subunit
MSASHPSTNQSSIELVREPIDTNRLLARARRTDCGAILLFLGTTREWTGANQTEFLEYDAYESMAVSEMQKLVDEALNRWPIKCVSIVHRLGRVDLGEASVAIVVSSPHRGPAFQAGEWLIDRLKELVPIWKKDYLAAGSSAWLHPPMIAPEKP